MKRTIAYSVLVVVAAATALVVVAKTQQTDTEQTPTHVTAVLVDGLNHYDLRAVCSTLQPSVVKRNWNSVAGCEQYFTINMSNAALMGYPAGGYKVVPHSYRGWRVGDTKVATVLFHYVPLGVRSASLKATLVKTVYGWKIRRIS